MLFVQNQNGLLQIADDVSYLLHFSLASFKQSH